MLLVFSRVFLTLYLAQTTLAQDPIDGTALSTTLHKFINSNLGAASMQQIFDRTTIDLQQLDGQAILDQVETVISERFQSAYAAVQKLKLEIENGYAQDDFTVNVDQDDPRQCCKVDDSSLLYSNRYQGKVNTKKTCFRFSGQADSTSTVPYSNTLNATMTDNGLDLDKNIIKWQYFGTTDGVSITYPYRKIEGDCDSFDPRTKPWYVESATSLPMDIVLVIELSKATTDHINLITKAATTVVDTLNQDDRIGIVAFAEEGQSPGEQGRECFNTELAFATPDTKTYLKGWINDQSSRKTQPNYINALRNAFVFFHDLAPITDPRSRRRLMLFMTDEQPSDDGSDGQRILNVTRDENAAVNNSVIISTYGIGDLAQSLQELLINMANQSNANLSYGPITPGKFTHVRDASQLRRHVSSYYDLLSDNLEEHPTVTSPRVDEEGLGLVVWVCLPVRHEGKLKGVTCVVISLSETLSDIFHTTHGNKAYAFISDYKSRCIMHPLMPNPINYGRTVYLNVEDLETVPDVRFHVLESMRRRESGSKNIDSKFVTARGNSTTDGVEAKPFPAHYFWKPIRSTNFSLCVVTTDEDSQMRVDRDHLHSQNFVYHRLDLVDDDIVLKCAYNQRLSTTEHSVVKLSSAAFVDPYKDYVNKEETSIQVKEYTFYMQNPRSQEDDKIKHITKQIVAESEPIEDFWKQSEFDKNVVWRYFGDMFGAIRIYPGLPLDKNYDHTKRAWFLKAVSVASQESIEMSLTPPYLDAFGAGIVVSLTHPIRAIGSGPLLGIISLDFKFSYIQYLVPEMFPACKADDNVCFIVDTSGFLVYHDDIKLDKDSKEAREIDAYHITETEPDIAQYLINEGKLTKKSCTDFGSKKSLHSWRLHLVFSIPSIDNEPYFMLQKVNNINIYLGMKRKSHRGNICPCPDRNVADRDYNPIIQCESSADKACECPCYTYATYQECRNEFGETSRSEVACVPQPTSIGFKPLENERLPTNRCWPCDIFNTHGECEESGSSCRWCDATKQCSSVNSCPTPVPNEHTEDPPDPSTPVPVGVLVGSLVGVLVILTLVVLVVLGVRGQLPCKKGRNPESGRYLPDPDYDMPANRRSEVPDITQMMPTCAFSPKAIGNPVYKEEDPTYLHTNEVKNLRLGTPPEVPSPRKDSLGTIAAMF